MKGCERRVELRDARRRAPAAPAAGPEMPPESRRSMETKAVSLGNVLIYKKLKTVAKLSFSNRFDRAESEALKILQVSYTFQLQGVGSFRAQMVQIVR